MSTFDRLLAGLDSPGIDVDLTKVTPEASLRQDLGFDSLDEVCLELMIEEEFHVEVPDGASTTWNTIADVVAFIDAATSDTSGTEGA